MGVMYRSRINDNGYCFKTVYLAIDYRKVPVGILKVLVNLRTCIKSYLLNILFKSHSEMFDFISFF